MRYNTRTVFFHGIADKVSSLFPDTQVMMSNDVAVGGIRFRPDKDGRLRQGFLYALFSGEELPATDMRDTSVSIMCKADKFCGVVPDNHMNVILVSELDEAGDVCAAVSDYMLERTALLDNCNRVWNSLSAGMNVRSILEEGSSILGGPLQIFDLNFRLVDFVVPSDFEDVHFNQLNKVGKLPPDVMVSYEESRYIEKLGNKEQILCFEHPGRKHRSVWTKILDGGQLSAYLVNLTPNWGEIPQEEKDMLLTLSRALSICLKHDQDIQNINDLRFEQIAIRGLKGHISDYESFAKQFCAFTDIRWSKPQVGVFVSKSGDVSNTPFNYLKDELSEILDEGKCLTYRDSIVMIINCRDNTISERTRSQILDFVERHDMCCGFSVVADNVLKLRDLYLQAGLALEVGGRVSQKLRGYRFEDYTPYYPLHAFAENNDLMQLCDKAVEMLYRFDQEHDTELLNTMAVYLRNRSRVQCAASDLHLHRNSLYYRLEQIKDITGVDLNMLENERFFSLVDSIRILEYLQKV